jgi:hypothetical protein
MTLFERVSIATISADNFDFLCNDYNITTASTGSDVAALFVADSSPNMTPNTIGNIYTFHRDQVNTLDLAKLRLVKSEPNQVTTAAVPLGGHMIVGRGMNANDVAGRFAQLAPMFAPLESDDPDVVTIKDFRRALHSAKSIGWADFDPACTDDCASMMLHRHKGVPALRRHG